MQGQWDETPGTGSDIRPASLRFKHPKLTAFTIVAAPVMTTDLSRFGGDYGSIPVAFTVDAETFNREVGWVVARWHWSVVQMGRVVGSGDESTREAAMRAAEDSTRAALGRKRSVIEQVWPFVPTCSGCGKSWGVIEAGYGHSETCPVMGPPPTEAYVS